MSSFAFVLCLVKSLGRTKNKREGEEKEREGRREGGERMKRRERREREGTIPFSVLDRRAKGNSFRVGDSNSLAGMQHLA